MHALPSMPRLARLGAQAACALGAGVWIALLWAPGPADPPPLLASAPPAGFDTAPVAAWFGGAQARVRVEVQGLIASGDERGAALLSVDGAPPRAYRVGDVLAPGVVLAGVTPEGARIEQDGEAHLAPAPADPRDTVQGFVPADSAAGRPGSAAGRPDSAAGRPDSAAGRPDSAAGLPDSAAGHSSSAARRAGPAAGSS